MKTESREKALRDIAGAMNPQEEKPDISPGTVGDMLRAVMQEPNAGKRKKIMKNFSARHADAADFIAQNEALINAEAEAALIGAAVGGTVTEKEISYKGGRKHVVMREKRNAPNIAALSLFLKNRIPDRYSDKPQTETEVEDLSELEEAIGNEQGKTEKDYPV